MSESRYEIGMRERRAVLGDAHVERAEARKKAFDAPFQQFIVVPQFLKLIFGDKLIIHAVFFIRTARTGGHGGDEFEAAIGVFQVSENGIFTHAGWPGEHK